MSPRVPIKVALFTAIIVCSLLIMTTSSGNTIAAAPGAPEQLTYHSGDNFVNLAWLPPSSDSGSGLTNYTVYRGTSVEDMEFLANVTANITAYHDDDVSVRDTYYYCVTVWNQDNESASSNAVVVTIESIEKTDDGTLLSIVAIAISVVALQLAIVALWVMIRKAIK